MLRRLDLATRVLLVAALPIALIAVALAWYFTATRILELEDGMRDRGLAVARQLAAAAAHGTDAAHADLLDSLAASAVREHEVNGVTIVAAGGGVLATAGAQPRPAEWLRSPLPGAATLLPGPADELRFYAPIASPSAGPVAAEGATTPGDPETAAGGSLAPSGAVLVRLSLQPLEDRKLALWFNAALIALGGLALAVALAQWLARGVTRPVLRLAKTVASVERGDLSARAAVTSPGALGTLEAGVNDMVASLASARRDLERRVAQATAELSRQKEAAETANRAKTQFLAAASHDLRQPIQALGLFAMTLRLRARTTDILALADRIERSVNALANVLDALLDISKLDAGVVTPHIESFPVARVLDAVRETFAGVAAEKGIALTVRRASCWVKTDPFMLERIVANLVSNALRYTDRGGVLVGCRPAGRSVRIEVWDTGFGIPEPLQREIFREFVQLANPGRARDKGLGLGLAIVDRYCRLLAIEVTVRSKVKRGTVFAITLPRAAPQPLLLRTEPPPAAARTSAEIAGRRYLVIDDDAEVREGVASLLAALGATAVTAAGVDEALGAWKAVGGMPDALLTDYRLGARHDGLDAARAIREAFGPVPVVVLTGDIGSNVLRSVAEAGLALVHKPVSSADLVAALEAARASAGVGREGAAVERGHAP
jgi:signal transduction histidine kinase/ActR/RegA family two-component response regulator